MGNNATTGMGMASETHHVIIRPAIASALQAFAFTPKGLRKYISKATAIPASSVMNLKCGFGFCSSRKKYLRIKINET